MSFDFFRKERPAVFEERFKAPAPPATAWSLKSRLIFQAKNYSGSKKFKIKVAGVDYSLDVTVQGTEIFVKKQVGQPGPNTSLRISEGNLADALDHPNESSLLYNVARKLAKDHATSSASSPLISGCNVDNFQASKTYTGNKLCIKLRIRQPVKNPFVSGLEKEYFLIGQVLDTDCESILYFGSTDETLNETVNPVTS